MDEDGMRFLTMKSPFTSETLALHQALKFTQKSCKQEEF